jgi:hypothetical protein
MTMKGSLRALLTGLIDYAGMFPPAALPLADAVMNHLSYRKSPEAWMLGRFVLPAARLQEVANTDLTVAALGRGGPARSFVDGLHADLGLIEEAREASDGRLVVDVLETKLPPEFVASPQAIRPFLTGTCEMYERAGVRLFFEVPPGGVERVHEALAAIGTGPDTPGVKLRAGGQEPAAFPSSEQVAATLWGCSADGLEFKATAGLHHPLPRFDPEVKARLHGFLNVFVAGVLIHAGALTPKETIDLLDERSPENFDFGDGGLSWRGRPATLAQVRDARQTFVRSFGSCSFDEPRDDLRGLGWL